MTQPEPDPDQPPHGPDPGRGGRGTAGPAGHDGHNGQGWGDAALPEREPPAQSRGDLLDDPVIRDAIRRLELLDQAQNLRLRCEADLLRAQEAGRLGEPGLQRGYLRRALWNIRAAHRLQDGAGEGMDLPARETAAPTLDMRYSFRGLCGAPSCCRLRVFEPKGKPVVVVTELDDNPGTSVTNFAEELATDVGELLEQPTDMVWIEHYPERGPAYRRLPESFDRVTFAWTGRHFAGPQWRRLSRAAVETLIGGPLEEGESPE